MSLFRLVRQHRAETANTEIAQIKASRRIKRFRILRFLLIVCLSIFIIAILIALMNNWFHWWTVLPWPKERGPITSAPEVTDAERIFLGIKTR